MERESSPVLGERLRGCAFRCAPGTGGTFRKTSTLVSALNRCRQKPIQLASNPGCDCPETVTLVCCKSEIVGGTTHRGASVSAHLGDNESHRHRIGQWVQPTSVDQAANLVLDSTTDVHATSSPQASARHAAVPTPFGRLGSNAVDDQPVRVNCGYLHSPGPAIGEICTNRHIALPATEYRRYAADRSIWTTPAGRAPPCRSAPRADLPNSWMRGERTGHCTRRSEGSNWSRGFQFLA